MSSSPSGSSATPEVRVNEFRSLHAVVIGDAMLDVRLRGSVTRLCPEGPFPIVDVEHEQLSLGGAANVAANLAGLGVHVSMVSVLGGDDHGRQVVDLAAGAGIDVSSVVLDATRATLVKRRVVGEGITLLRLDTGSKGPASNGSHEFQRTAAELSRSADLIVLSDYGYGVLSSELIEVMAFSRDQGVLVVDSKDPSRFLRLAPDVVTSNYAEVIGVVGGPDRRKRERIRHLREIGGAALAATGATSMAVTVDEDGVAVLDAHGSFDHLPSRGKGNDVCGAGDTFTATLGAAMAAGSSAVEAAWLGCHAAGVVMAKPGTAVCTAYELLVASGEGFLDRAGITMVCEEYRQAGRSIVFTNGCFDVLHSGHVASLREASELGDVLIVGVNTDEAVRTLKGPDRPVNSLQDRMNVIAGLAGVDHVVPFGERTPLKLLAAIRPDIYCKGGDYESPTVVEADLIASWGGRFISTTYIPEHSTTGIMHRVRRGLAVADL